MSLHDIKVEVRLSGEQMVLAGERGKEEERRPGLLTCLTYNVSCTKMSLYNIVPGTIYTEYEFLSSFINFKLLQILASKLYATIGKYNIFLRQKDYSVLNFDEDKQNCREKEKST